MRRHWGYVGCGGERWKIVVLFNKGVHIAASSHLLPDSTRIPLEPFLVAFLQIGLGHQTEIGIARATGFVTATAATACPPGEA